jgi:hypothetical protein
VRFDVLRLRFRQLVNSAGSVVETGDNQGPLVGRGSLRRWCFGLAVTVCTLGLLAIGLGFSTSGIAVYVAAILPLAFFS